jgi:MYXO-CTERM domain-containing protein
MSEPGGPDAGSTGVDASVPAPDAASDAQDAGGLDAGLDAPDAGPASTPPGCGCRSARASREAWAPLALAALGLLVVARHRRRV